MTRRRATRSESRSVCLWISALRQRQTLLLSGPSCRADVVLRTVHLGSSGGGGGAIVMRQLSVKRNRLFKQHFFTSGRHYWEVDIMRMSSVDYGSSAAVVVGIAANENFECESLSDPDAISSSWANGAVGYAASGAIVRNGVEFGYAQPYKEGDIVGVLLDMNSQSIAFFLNGEEQRFAVESPWSSTVENATDDVSEEQKQDDCSRAPQLPQIDCCFSRHSVFPALTYSVETDQVELSLCYPPPKHIPQICM